MHRLQCSSSHGLPQLIQSRSHSKNFINLSSFSINLQKNCRTRWLILFLYTIILTIHTNYSNYFSEKKFVTLFSLKLLRSHFWIKMKSLYLWNWRLGHCQVTLLSFGKQIGSTGNGQQETISHALITKTNINSSFKIASKKCLTNQTISIYKTKTYLIKEYVVKYINNNR